MAIGRAYPPGLADQLKLVRGLAKSIAGSVVIGGSVTCAWFYALFRAADTQIPYMRWCG
ncbi:hypothetical protein ACWEQ8_02610 [Streptomyces noursei]